MTEYRVVVSEGAARALKKLDKPILKQIRKRISHLRTNAEDIKHKPLTGQWSGVYSLRVGDYRILYLIYPDDKTIEIEAVGHRRDIYDTK